ncbi:MAG: M20/M25/M40 family metallo-hydrolase [Planctomycetota bacterium]
MSDAERVIERLEGDRASAVERLIEWLKIPSISTDPAYREQAREAAVWCADRLREAGLEPQLRETGTPDAPGHPIVWAYHEGPADHKGPHVVFYGHYDVQPPDPIELWDSAPFEPVVMPAEAGDPRDVPGERVVARGAVDDKGQVAGFLEAIRAWHAEHGGLPIRLTVLIEGEEESGSVNLERFVEQEKAHLSTCDVCVISDTGMLGRGQPAITTGVRGLAYTEIVLTGPDQDLHSGMWGGRVANPINVLTRLLAQLHDDDGRVTIPGFYDSVVEPPRAERDAWASLPMDHVGALEKIGLPREADAGEKGWTSVEREWARPTCDVNGVYGGYTGAGAKTVIPSKAGAKVSFRLVADQDPETIAASFRAWVEERLPVGFSLDFHDHGGGHPGAVPFDSPYLAAASDALEAASGTKAHMIKSGGSIPVVGLLKKELDLDTLLVGFGLDDDRVHSPNEKFELECFRLCARTHAHLLERFASLGG